MNKPMIASPLKTILRMKVIEEKQRKTKSEIFMILIKTIVFILLIYAKISKPSLFIHYHWVATANSALIVFLGPSIAVSFLRLIIIYWYIRKHRLKPNIKDNFILGINRIVSILNTAFGVVAFMIFMGIEPLEFLTSITIVAAAIAIVFKDYITNMINGLIIMFSDRLSLGDHIKVQDTEGKILDITLINIILQNEDNDMVILPNSIIFSSVIINQSKQNIKKLSIEFELSLHFGFSPEYLEMYLSKAVTRFSDYIVSGGLTIKTLAINKDSAVFKVQVLLNNYDKLKEREIRKTLNTAVIRLSAPNPEQENS
jgi:small-conductance mechanosensitive channel